MTCPECGRPWLYDLTYQHAVTCGLYLADSATAAADRERRPGIRQPTPTEQEFINALNYPTPGPGEQFWIRHSHTGVHNRVVFVGPADATDYADPRLRPAERA